MKKRWLVLATTLMAFALAACGGGNKKPVDPTEGGHTSVPPVTTPTGTPTQGPTTQETIYYVVGTFNGWTTKDENYVMTKVADEEDHYIFEGLQLLEGAGVKCVDDKVNWYPDGMGNDTIAPENGVYTVHLHTTALKSEMTTLEKTGDYDPGEMTIDYFLAGTFNDWTPKDEDYKMIEIEEEDAYYIDMTFTEEDKGTAGELEFKVTDSNNGWHGTGAEGGNAWVSEIGTYRITFYLHPTGNDAIVATPMN